MGILKGALLVGAGIAAGFAAKKILDDCNDCRDFDDCCDCDCDSCECDDCDTCECCDDDDHSTIASADDIADNANDFDGNGDAVNYSENPDGELVKKEL